MVLPWVKIEALKTTVPEQYYAYPEFLWNTDSISATVTSSEAPRFHLSWDQGILSGGMLLAAVYFGYKLYQIYKLRNAGAIQRFPNFTQIVVKNSELAFSFFKSIFLGDKVVQREYQSIIQHELVHIEQRHSWDLLFFELMRIVGWFNPLVYVYQNRVSELHEFIADSKVAKTDKKEQYEFLLSQIFQTENISFVNQFFKSSLIRKRIAMLQRKQSKKVWQLKYLLLVPLLLGMLLYTSSEAQESESIQQKQTSDDADLIDKLNAKIDIEIEKSGSLNKVFHKFRKEHDFFGFDYIMSKDEYFENTLLFQRHSANFSDSLKKAETPFFRGFRKQPLPSTTRYKSYVVRTEAFLILDDNLRVSISTNRNNEGLGARPVELKNTKTEGYLIFEVENIKDLTGDEVRAFNNKLDAVFNQNHSEYSGMVLKDGHYAFEIFETEPFNKLIEIQNDTKLFSEKPTTIDRYNQLVAERKRLLKSSNENNPVIVNLDQQIAGLRKTVFGDGETIPFAVVEEVPVFPGCEDEKDKRACYQKSMQRHISKNFRYPQEAQEKGIQGRVAIMFTISETGSIDNIKMRGPHQLLEDEAERIIALLPEMKPGKDKGELVNVPFSIPITFKLKSGFSGDIGSMGSRFEVLPSNISSDPELIATVERYNQLVLERQRLLKNSTEENPVIVNLDNQLRGLVTTIYASGKYGAIPFAKVDQVPIFPDCEDVQDKRACFQQRMQRHISKNFRYPEEAQKQSIQGRVGILFTITSDGNIENIHAGGPNKLLEDEASRIISRLPNMQPGKHKGQLVDVAYSIPITFKLEDNGVMFRKKLNLETTNDSRPLIIIDGEESTKEVLDNMDPNDIGSINVLKDESANNEYGEKGKNGVVEIFTKKNNNVVSALKNANAEKAPKLEEDEVTPHTSLNLDAMNVIQTPPLYIIDGEESTKEEMGYINPKDIAEINVYKDESALSVYGEKGKNGVVVITTKKNQNDTEESNEVYRADTNTMSVTATAKDKNGIKIITGTVTDGMMGLPVATIGIEGSERGVISDFDGKFEIKAKKGDVILFQYIGLPILKCTVTDEENYQITKKK